MKEEEMDDEERLCDQKKLSNAATKIEHGAASNFAWSGVTASACRARLLHFVPDRVVTLG